MAPTQTNRTRPPEMKSLAGSVKDAEQQTAALNLAVAKLEGSGSSKTTKLGGKTKKVTAPATEGDTKAKHKARDADASGKDQESEAEVEDDPPSDPPSSSDESRPPSTPCRRRPKHDQSPRRRSPDDDADDSIPTQILKTDLPMFDGSDNPLIWLNRCEIYFRGNQTPSHRRVWMA